MIEVVRVGLLATVQDLGRPGWAHLGVPRSGALDRPSLVRANRLTGNPDGAAAIEIALRGLTIRSGEPSVIAVTGAPCDIAVGGEPAPCDERIEIAAGVTVTIGRAAEGARSYLAVAGGVDVPEVLGSRSYDSLSGLGPAPLRAGDWLPVGPSRPGPQPAGSQPAGSPAGRGPATQTPFARTPFAQAPRTQTPFARTPFAQAPRTRITSHAMARVWFGPRDDWFDSASKDVLTSSPYQLTPRSNRVGARLAGPALTRANLAELPSEPLVLGAVQVLADGQPVVFLADHPTTGGYPVIGVVDERDLATLSQIKPGGTVRFVAASVALPAGAEAEARRGSQC